MKIVRFFKRGEEWYIDLPEYINLPISPLLSPSFKPKWDDLKMVLGMDTFLEGISEGEQEFKLFMTNEIDEIRAKEGIPAFAKHNWEFLARVDYVKTFEGKYYTGYNSQYVYFQPTMMMLFGDFPQYIYYKIVKNDVQTQKDGPDF